MGDGSSGKVRISDTIFEISSGSRTQLCVHVADALISLLGPEGQLAHPSAEQELELNGAV